MNFLRIFKTQMLQNNKLHFKMKNSLINPKKVQNKSLLSKMFICLKSKIVIYKIINKKKINSSNLGMNK